MNWATMSWKCNNRHIVYSPGPSQWAFDADCRWLWLDSLFCLCPLVQDHIYDVGVPSDPLPPLLRLLLLQRADVCAAGSAHLLGRAHLAHGHQIPARQRTNRHFFNFPHLPHNLNPAAVQIVCFFFTWQDIVEDERSDKEETESEDDGDDREQREKSKNGHVQNGHTPLNNNHSKTDWLDLVWELEMRLCDDGPSHVALTWKPKNGSVACWKEQQAAHTHTHTHTHTDIHTLLSETQVVQWVTSLWIALN